MGANARRVVLRKSPGERFDLGLELSEAMMRTVILDSRALDSSDEEEARRGFQALRRANR